MAPTTPRSGKKARNDERTPGRQQTQSTTSSPSTQNVAVVSTTTMSSNNNNIDTAIRVILFSGKQRDWMQWEEKFLAKAKRKGMKDMFLGKPEDIPKATKSSHSSDEIKIMEQNETAYAELIMSIDTSTPAGKIAFRISEGK